MVHNTTEKYWLKIILMMILNQQHDQMILYHILAYFLFYEKIC